MATEVDTTSIMDPDKYRSVSTPAEVAKKAGTSATGIKAFLKKNVPGVAGMTGGGYAGGALGALLAPDTGGLSIAIPALTAALGSGAANVATTKGLPEEYGGDKNASTLKTFLMGAAPEAALGTAGRLAERGAIRAGEEALNRQGTETYETLAKAIKPQEVTSAEASKLARALGRQDLKPTPPLPMEARGAAVREYRDATTGPIDRMREKYGAPIGEAYKNIKKEHLGEPANVGDFVQTIPEIRNSAVSPISPNAQALLSEAEGMGNRVGESYVDTAADIRAQEGTPQGAAASVSIADSLRARKELSENLFRQKGAEIETEGPPTVDDVRNLRQRVQAALSKAQGGDRHVLGDLRQALDQKLVDYLPADIHTLRANYKQFIDTFPYQKINALRRTSTPSQVGDFAFGQSPEVALDIVRNANAGERKVLQQGFADRVLGDVDPDLPIPKQVEAVQKKLSPYVRNGTVKELYGPAANLQIRNIINVAPWRERLAAHFQSPTSQKVFETMWRSVAKNADATAQQAADAGLQAWMAQLPQEDQAMLKRMLVQRTPQNTPLPVLLGPEATTRNAIKEGLLGSAEKPGIEKYAARRMQFAGPQSAARVALGGAGGAAYGLSTGAAFASIAASKAGYRAALKAGGADAIARLYATKGGRATAQALFDLFASMGARAGQENLINDESP